MRIKEILISFVAGLAGACVYSHVTSLAAVHAQSGSAIQPVVQTRSLELIDAQGATAGTINAAGIQFGPGGDGFSLQAKGAPVLEIRAENGNLNALLTPNGLTLENVKQRKNEYLSLARLSHLK